MYFRNEKDNRDRYVYQGCKQKDGQSVILRNKNSLVKKIGQSIKISKTDNKDH